MWYFLRIDLRLYSFQILQKFIKSKKVLGKNTKDSVNSGFFWGYTGLINNIIKLIMKETKNKYKIILTGGLAHLLKDAINYKCNVDKDITLKGLIRLIWMMN